MNSESVLSLLLDARRARKGGASAIRQRQRTRLADMVSFARANSPYYRELYQDLPQRVEDAALLPVTSKRKLMARFDDWVTDRNVAIDSVREFISDRNRIGERFLDRYTALTTSGTTGTPGILVWDDRSMAVTNVLALRMLGSWVRIHDVVRIIARGGRITLVCATGGHYAEAVAGARLRKRLGDKTVQVLPAAAPIIEMVAELNRFRPAILTPYASVGAQLANEQQAGRLHINPALLVLSAEGLPKAGYDWVAKAFGVNVRHSYAATECPFISYSCDHGWLHVNTDWVVIEPVDAEYRAVQPGTRSHTLLISNLANRVQPILRYDIGDRIVERPDPCPCGNTLPAIRVQGRTADMLTFMTNEGKSVSIPALMFEVADTAGVELFQIVQTAPTNLRVRLTVATGADPDGVWKATRAEITRLLGEHSLDHVTVERAAEPPEQSPGGKYRQVVPLA